jgi:hypothetical protein
MSMDLRRWLRAGFAGLAITCVLFCAREGMGQSHVRSYKETICIRPNGSAEVTSTIAIGEYVGSDLSLPLNYQWVERISARVQETGATLPVEIASVDGIDRLRVTLGQTSISNKTLVLAFRDPAYFLWKNAGPGEFGFYEYKTEFQNTSALAIDELAMEVVLPEGYILHRIVKSVPGLTRKDPTPPYSFVNSKGTSHLFITARNLTPGRSCMLQYTFVAKKVSYVFLSVCIVLMLLSLVVFRGMLKE